MAETAALTSAHAHSRKATEELHQEHWTQAAEEHEKSAKEFARTARGTGDAEALRVLQLLEEQHKTLASILWSEESSKQDTASDDSKQAVSPPSREDASSATRSRFSPVDQKPERTSSAPKAARTDGQKRDSSPSLAREIALRRGIPQKNTLSPAAQARARQLSPESRRRGPTPAALMPPPSIVDSQSNLQQAKKEEDDEGFAKFYSNLTAGTMSKLSSVLAYAGLPLSTEDTQMDSLGQKPDNPTVSAYNNPDVKKIFSKAALDAIEEEHRRRGTLGHGFGPAESFYIVQKGGGTYSYADIARAKQNKLGGIDEDEEAEFVDAKELPGPPSPNPARLTHPRRTSFGSARTTEELDLENATLKQTLEHVASRLAAFEAHAQDASMAALTQSMATLRPQRSGDSAMEERLRLLEKQVEKQAEDRQRLETQAAKQEKRLKKYESKWEEIKKSAKEKERVKKEKAGKESEDVAGDVLEPGAR